MSNNYFVDIHIVQTVPPSCINRDDANSPKTALYGGTVRSRVSSQAWKRAIREGFPYLYADDSKLGKRTMNVIDMIADEVLKKDPSLDRSDVAKGVLALFKKAKIKTDDDKAKTKALFFMSNAQAKNMAELYLSSEC